MRTERQSDAPMPSQSPIRRSRPRVEGFGIGWPAAVVMAALISAWGCGPRGPVRTPGISGLERDWTRALRHRDLSTFASLFDDQRMERPPGLSLKPASRLGGRIVPLRWNADPRFSLDVGMFGQFGILTSVSRVSVRAVSLHLMGARKALARIRIRLDGRVRGGYARSDMGSLDVVLWRRAYNGPWYLSDVRKFSVFTLVGLGQSLVDRTASWLKEEARHPGRGAGSGPGMLATDDFDGDGRPDLVWWDGATLSVWRWTGRGFRVWGRRLGVRPAPARGEIVWRLLDRDGDGRPELVLSPRLWVGFAGKAPTLHREQRPLRLGRGPHSDALPRSLRAQLGRELRLVVATSALDLDQDGMPERLVLMRGPEQDEQAGLLTLRLYWWVPDRASGSNSGRWLDVAHVAGLPRAVASFVVADFDGDGGDDLALLTKRGPRLYRNLFDRGQWARVRLVSVRGRPLSGALVTIFGDHGAVASRYSLGARGRPLTRLLVGLGASSKARVSVRFQGGGVVRSVLAAGRTTVLSPLGVRGGAARKGPVRLGPATLDGPAVQKWLGFSAQQSRGLQGRVVMVVCDSVRARSCRNLAMRIRGFLKSHDISARLLLLWLQRPAGSAVRQPHLWVERVLDPARAARFLPGALLPRVMVYVKGRLRSLLVGPGPERLQFELGARFLRGNDTENR